MKALLACILSLFVSWTAQADDKPLYHQVLRAMEPRIPRAPGSEAESRRLQEALAALRDAYATLYPDAPAPRLLLTGGKGRHVTARTLDTGLILIDPDSSASLPGEALTGMLAHELAHIALEHGWERAALALGSVKGSRFERMRAALTGHHPLRGDRRWEALRHHQEFQADQEGRRLLAQAGLPTTWLADAILSGPAARATGTHPSDDQRLLALARY